MIDAELDRMEALSGERLDDADRTRLRGLMSEWLMLSAQEKLAVIREQQTQNTAMVRAEERRRMHDAMHNLQRMSADDGQSSSPTHRPHHRWAQPLSLLVLRVCVYQ